MKYLCVFFSMLFIGNINAQYALANEHQNLTVSGDAILRIKPDQVFLNIGVELRGDQLIETKQKNSKIIKDAILYCKSMGIPEKYIQTDYVRIDPRYQHGKSTKVSYFNVTQSMSIIIEDLDKYETMLTELLNLGINKVNNISFKTTKLKEYRKKVRKMAVKAAKEKAEFLADEAGIALDKIINIRESSHNPVNSFSRYNYANVSQNVTQQNYEGGDESELSVGMLSLKANVTLIYKVKT